MAVPSSRATFRFGEFEVDTVAYELRRQGKRLRLTGQPMDLLVLLLERAGELVRHEEIAKRLWTQDVFVDLDGAIRTAIRKIRQALDDSPQSSRFLQTVSGKGYRFIEPVNVVSPSASRRLVTDNLPAELTSFVGRRRELFELPRALASSRMLCLTGAGGVGKTRLALQLARQIAGQFLDGVWFVDLAPVSQPDLMVQTVAATLHIREGVHRSVREVMLDALRDRELLLVLDTCEHLVEACADLVRAMLGAASGLRVIATSREPLGVPGEMVYRVVSLPLPDHTAPAGVDALFQSDATQLFIDRAAAVELSFRATDENADPIARLCRRLDGIPLAIELAAARVSILSPQQIEHRLDDRFRLLTGGSRTSVARQRTLEATVEWSYQLLSDHERRLLNRLSVFPATWSLAAVELVCGGDGIEPDDVIDLLARLVAKSLIVVEEELAGGRRYRLLETVRHYARAQLLADEDADRIRQKHFEFFFEQFRSAESILHGREQVAMLQRLTVEQENVRAALEWALATPTASGAALELTGALFWFWTKRGQFREGAQWLERALATSSETATSIRARALIGLGHMHYFQGHPRDVQPVVERALALGHELASARVISTCLFMQGLLAFESGNNETAAALAEDARRVAVDGGEPAEEAPPLITLASLAAADGDYERAQALYDRSIEVQRQVGELWGLSISLLVAASLRIVRDEFEHAQTQASEALALCEQLDDRRGVAWSFNVFAGLFAARGESATAAQLWGASDALLESVGGVIMPPLTWIRDRHFERVRIALGPESFSAFYKEGRSASGSIEVRVIDDWKETAR